VSDSLAELDALPRPAAWPRFARSKLAIQNSTTGSHNLMATAGRQSTHRLKLK